MKQAGPVTKWLSQANGFIFTLYATVAAFCTYSCMYAFRKPFSATSYEGIDVSFMGLDSYKSALIIGQIIGYTLSKFIGIKVVSEMGRGRRAMAILVLIGIAELALLAFAILPENWKVAAMFVNGLPLGMVWGLVFSFLEGRKYTEAMGAGLCASFIFASGFVKSIGSTLILDYGVPEFWMPSITGLIFAVPLVFFVWMLSQVPDPTPEDEALRTRREPMNGKQRWAFFKRFAPGLILLVLTYMVVTTFRDFRDSFMAEILEALGYAEEPELFTTLEVPVTLGVLALLAFIMYIRDNRRALLVNHAAIFIGVVSAGISTFAWQQGWMGALSWVMMTGFATYVAYIPFNALLFERLIAAYKYVANAGFLIYVADAFGYLGVVGVLVYKDYFLRDMSWLNFFININYVLAILGGALTLFALIYFKMRRPTDVEVHIHDDQ